MVGVEGKAAASASPRALFCAEFLPAGAFTVPGPLACYAALGSDSCGVGILVVPSLAVFFASRRAASKGERHQRSLLNTTSLFTRSGLPNFGNGRLGDGRRAARRCRVGIGIVDVPPVPKW